MKRTIGRFWIDLGLSSLVIGRRDGNRRRSLLVTWTPAGYRWIHNDYMAFANDIHVFGPFRYSDTWD